MAETITLALDGRYECFTLGKEIKIERVREIAALAERHGFRLGGFRSFEHAVDDDEIERVAHRSVPAVICATIAVACASSMWRPE